MNKTIVDFLRQPVIFLFPNSSFELGILASGNGYYGFRGGAGFHETLISEVREITAPVYVNLIRAVIVLKNP